MAHDQPDIFLLRGHPRSGTNWIGRLLDLHPRVGCFGEFDFTHLTAAFGNFVGRDWHAVHAEPHRGAAAEAFGAFVRACVLSFAAEKPGARWIGERTPVGIEPLALVGAPVIHVLRDGRDVLVSWTHHQHRRQLDGTGGLRGRMVRQTMAYAADPEHFKKHPGSLLADESWVREVARGWAQRFRADRRSIERAGAGALGCRAHAIRYEELLAQTDEVRSGLYAFLGLDPGEAAGLESGVKTAAGFASEDPGGFNRRGEAGDWVNYFTDEQKRWFKEEAGAALVEAGYAKDEGW